MMKKILFPVLIAFLCFGFIKAYPLLNDVDYEIISPEPGSEVEEGEKPVVALTLFYGESVIPKDQLRLEFDGQDVTNEAKISSYFISYVPRQKVDGGQKKIRLTAKEANGSVKEIVSWEFTMKGEIKKAPQPIVYEEVDARPFFVGGDVALMEYLKATIQYPKRALKMGLSGVVVVEFTVLEDGSIKDAIVLRGFNQECEEEALRVIKSMPNWEPGRQNNIPVRARFIQPIEFRTSGPKRTGAY